MTLLPLGSEGLEAIPALFFCFGRENENISRRRTILNSLQPLLPSLESHCMAQGGWWSLSFPWQMEKSEVRVGYFPCFIVFKPFQKLSEFPNRGVDWHHINES